MPCEVNIDDKGSYPHTPHSPTPSSLRVWDIASEAVLSPDATIGYWPKGMEEFAAKVGGSGLRGWMRDWVEGRSLVSASDLCNVCELTTRISSWLAQMSLRLSFSLHLSPFLPVHR